jgi:ribosome-associated protein
VKNKTSFTGEAFLKAMCKVLDDNKALDVIVIDLVDKTSFSDHMIIASGTSQRHLLALGDYLQIEAAKLGHSYVRIEGKENGADWILVDLGNIIVHLFRPETRQLYDLESMWGSHFLAAKQG